MKKTLFIALLLIPFLGIAQTKPIEGFLGVKFGTSKADVIAALKAKGCILDEKDSKDDLLYFDNVKLGSHQASYLSVTFVDDKAYLADFYFKPEVEGDTFKVFNSIADDLNGVYGAGKFYQHFESPYNNDDSD